MKKELNFEVRSSYYLGIPDEKYLPIVLYSMIARKNMKQGTLNVYNSFDKNIQAGIS